MIDSGCDRLKHADRRCPVSRRAKDQRTGQSHRALAERPTSAGPRGVSTSRRPVPPRRCDQPDGDLRASRLEVAGCADRGTAARSKISLPERAAVSLPRQPLPAEAERVDLFVSWPSQAFRQDGERSSPDFSDSRGQLASIAQARRAEISGRWRTLSPTASGATLPTAPAPVSASMPGPRRPRAWHRRGGREVCVLPGYRSSRVVAVPMGWAQGVTTSLRGGLVLRCSQVRLMSSSRVWSRSKVSFPSIA